MCGYFHSRLLLLVPLSPIMALISAPVIPEPSDSAPLPHSCFPSEKDLS